MPAATSSPLLGLLALVALAAPSCASHADAGPAPGTEGLATLTLDGTSGSQGLTIGGPPGELWLSFFESETACTLTLVAQDPRAGDATSEAKARRVRLDVQVTTKEAPALLGGQVATANAHAGFVFTSDSSVELWRNRGPSLEDHWWSGGGGTITVSAIQDVIGSEVVLDLHGVALKPEDDEGAAILSGRVTAKLAALVVIVKPGGCPAGTPGRR